MIAGISPDFDTRTYGAAKISDLAARLTSRFEVRKRGNLLEMRDVA